jgi:peroxiredoxin
MMSTKRLWAAVISGTAALALASGAFAQDSKPAKDEKPAKAAQPDSPKDSGKKDSGKKDSGKKDEGKKGGVAVGQQAPAIALKDTDGKDHTLAEHVKAGHITVLQWFNPECPFVVKHYEGASKTFNDLHAKYASKGVAFFAVNSGAPGEQGAGHKTNAEIKKKWDIPYPILLDESGTVGRAYGAKNTPLMVIIAKDGTIAYFGAIDDEPAPGKTGKTNYVAKALDELLAGSNVTMPTTKPYGCAVKYGRGKN